MASFPGAKVHRVGNRRKLGRGQQPLALPLSITVTAGAADTMKIVSNEPVVWQPAIAATVTGLTIMSQAVISQTEVEITFSGTIATKAYTVPPGAGTGYTGGATLSASGTF